MPNGAPPPIVATLMALPTDIMNLATRQITEAVNTFNAGAQRFAVAAAAPPELPALPGAAAFPAGLPFPPFPGMAPAGAVAPPPAPVPQGIQQAAQAARAKPGFII